MTKPRVKKPRANVPLNIAIPVGTYQLYITQKDIDRASARRDATCYNIFNECLVATALQRRFNLEPAVIEMWHSSGKIITKLINTTLENQKLEFQPADLCEKLVSDWMLSKPVKPTRLKLTVTIRNY